MNGEFEFQFPWMLALLGLLPVYALLRGRTGKLSALTFSSADIARAAGGKARSAAGRLMAGLRLLTVALGIVALAGPRLANYHVETETPGIDILLVLDLSWSMMAIDMGKPSEKLSRYAIASRVLKDFIKKRPNDRIGLVAFSAVPYLASPLTLNHVWLAENLERLHVGLISDLGTAIGDAVAVALVLPVLLGGVDPAQVRTISQTLHAGQPQVLPDPPKKFDISAAGYTPASGASRERAEDDAATRWTVAMRELPGWCVEVTL